METQILELEARILARISEDLIGKSGEIVTVGKLTYERLYNGDESLAGWRVSTMSASVKVGLPNMNNKMGALRVAAVIFGLSEIPPTPVQLKWLQEGPDHDFEWGAYFMGMAYSAHKLPNGRWRADVVNTSELHTIGDFVGDARAIKACMDHFAIAYKESMTKNGN